MPTIITMPIQFLSIKNLNPAIEFASRATAEKNTINNFHHSIFVFISVIMFLISVKLVTFCAFNGTLVNDKIDGIRQHFTLVIAN